MYSDFNAEICFIIYESHTEKCEQQWSRECLTGVSDIHLDQFFQLENIFSKKVFEGNSLFFKYYN